MATCQDPFHLSGHASPHTHVFPSQLSFLDLNYISTFVPKMASNFLSGNRAILFIGCWIQCFLFLTLAVEEALILKSMAYDPYVIICFPLYYPIRIRRRVCSWSWIMGSVNSSAHTTYALHIPYCRSRTVDHLCDVPAMLTLACTATWIYDYTVFVSTTHFLALPFIDIECSYGHVLLAVNHMHSAEGRKKAYSTCFTHLTVVTFYYAPVVYTYLHSWPLQQKTRLWLSSTSSLHQGATLLSITRETRS